MELLIEVDVFNVILIISFSSVVSLEEDRLRFLIGEILGGESCCSCFCSSDNSFIINSGEGGRGMYS